MGFTSTPRALWLSVFFIIICLYFGLNSDTLSPSPVIRSGDKPQTQTPVTEEPAAVTATPTTNEDTCKNLGMIKQSSCPLPSCGPTPFIKEVNTAKTPDDQRPLITYAYYESEFARANLKFFVDHALHGAADFIFILNGETDAEKTIIFADEDIPEDLRDVIPKRDKKNIFVKKRNNTCFDLGAHNEVLNSVLGGEGWIGKDGPIEEPSGMASAGDSMLLRNKYKRFILMNASIRGPFVPRWSTQCWTDSYLNRLTDKIKLVGMSYNCHNGQGHIQSMIWATDYTGLQHILTRAGIGECFAEMAHAMLAEVRTTKVLRDAGFEVDTFISVYHSENRKAKYARMRAKKANGIEQFRRGEIGAPLEEEEVVQGALEAREEAKTDEQLKKEADAAAAAADKEKEKKAKEEKEKKEKEEEAKATPTTTHILTPSESAAAVAAEAEKARKEKEEKARKEEEARIRKEKEDKLLLTEDNDMPGYFWRECKHEDWLGPKSYFGTIVHPYETLFMKSHRHIDDTVLDRLTEWHNGWGYESWDVCF